MNITSYYEHPHGMYVLGGNTSVLQRKVDNLSIICRTPSSERIKHSLMQRNGAIVNMPLYQATFSQYLQRNSKWLKSLHYSLDKKYSKISPPKTPIRARPIIKNMPKEISPQIKTEKKKTVSKGLLLTRTAARINVTVTDDFWDDFNDSCHEKCTDLLLPKKGKLSTEMIIVTSDQELNTYPTTKFKERQKSNETCLPEIKKNNYNFL